MTLSDRDWQRLRRNFGDLAYEEPHRHVEMLAMIKPRIVVDNTRKN